MSPTESHKFRPKNGAYVGYGTKLKCANGEEYIILTKSMNGADRVAEALGLPMLDRDQMKKCELRGVKP